MAVVLSIYDLVNISMCKDINDNLHKWLVIHALGLDLESEYCIDSTSFDFIQVIW